jgi:putative restriction endonuclease
MKLYVGVTDYDWYELLSKRPDLDEVNFWSPGGSAFKVLTPGELFLFKLKAPHGHVIVGGGIFALDTPLPLSLAWDAFRERNGVTSLSEMSARIRRYQAAEARGPRDPVIGCRLIQQPFFLERDAWFRAPDSYPVNAVSGKSYDSDERDGKYLFAAAQERMAWSAFGAQAESVPTPGVGEPSRTGTPQLVLPRLGQGSFRIAVIDSFGRRCAVTGEKTLPLLDAAHIKPWAEGGQHAPGNGIALRTDVHRLFDLGYVTVTHDRRFEVSPRLREDYENGREYYALHGREIRIPQNPLFLPSREALDWHHENRWAKPGSVSAS